MNALDQLGVQVGDIPLDVAEAMLTALKDRWYADCGQPCNLCGPDRLAISWLEIKIEFYKQSLR